MLKTTEMLFTCIRLMMCVMTVSHTMTPSRIKCIFSDDFRGWMSVKSQNNQQSLTNILCGVINVLCHIFTFNVWNIWKLFEYVTLFSKRVFASIDELRAPFCTISTHTKKREECPGHKSKSFHKVGDFQAVAPHLDCNFQSENSFCTTGRYKNRN